MNVSSVLNRAKEGKIDDPDLKKAIDAFPYKAMENGSCEMLDDNGKCKVYDNRPELCNTDVMFEKVWSKKMSKSDYFKESARACNNMIKYSELPKEFLIDEKQFDE